MAGNVIAPAYASHYNCARSHNLLRGDAMTRKNIAILIAVLFVLGTLAFAADNPNMGTWKLNEGKSKFPAGATKNSTVVYASAGADQVKVTTDGTDGEGKPAHTDWTGKFDGKDYPLLGGAEGATRAYKKAGDRILLLTEKQNGKITATGRIVVAPDGNSRTVTATRNSPDGKSATSTAVYDKQ
jgi:hypothetical protein